MKTKLLLSKQNYYTFCTLLVFSLCVNFGWSQNLVLNGTCDLFTVTSDDVTANPTWTRNDSDNADAWDMTPPSTVIYDADAMSTGDTSPSPYNAVWNNSALEDWLELYYLGAAGSLDEQPGSTSGGNNGTRGVKLYMDSSPSLPGQSSRRLYQKVEGLTIGTDYIFSVDSRSEAAGTDSEVYILNTEIADETGINSNGSSDSSVDGYMDIIAADPWDTFSLNFTASNTFAVIYVRAPGAVDGDTEVFFDNFSLVEDSSMSVDEASVLNFSVYPNPAKNFLTIDTRSTTISSVEVFNIVGSKVIDQNEMTNNQLDVSSLSNGVYFLKISADNASVTKKFIVK